jgi:hypothetical protein
MNEAERPLDDWGRFWDKSFGALLQPGPTLRLEPVNLLVCTLEIGVKTQSFKSLFQ